MHERLQQVIEPVVEGLGCELWGIEFGGAGHRAYLKVFIDSEEGIDIDDCERVSRQVSSVLDVEDPVPGQYTLEVSSPGLDRRFFYPEQYAEFAGAMVAVKLRQPVGGRRKLKGELGAVDDSGVQVFVDGEEFRLPFDAIERANLVPEF